MIDTTIEKLFHSVPQLLPMSTVQELLVELVDKVVEELEPKEECIVCYDK